MDRRQFLRAGIAGAAGAAALPSVTAAAPRQAAGVSPYGSIEGREPDANGILLPAGFSSRIVAVAGEPVGDSEYMWPLYPDGAATFDDGEGGWYHAVNSEVFNEGLAGVSAIHYGPKGKILDAYPLLTGSLANCAGGPTPWGTWLSGEEDLANEKGLVWECDPTGEREAVSHPAMGRWAHEALAVDPEEERVYMTQDHPEGLLYRFTPTQYPDLTEGFVEAATVGPEGAVSWTELPDPSAESAHTREQLPDATRFQGGEGIWYFDGQIYFCTKYDNVVHSIDLRTQTYSEIYRANPDDVAAGTAVLSGVDNITVDAGTGDLFVAEDGGNMEVVVITPDGEVAPFLRVTGQDNSEVTGPAFNPRRDRLYFSSQRGPTNKTLTEINPGVESEDRTGGITYEITGPFRGVEPEPTPTTTTTTSTTTSTTAPTTTVPDTTVPETTAAATTVAATTTSIPSPTTTLAQAAEGNGDGSDDDEGGAGTVIAIGAAAGAIAIAAGAMVAFRSRRADDEGPNDLDPGSDA